MATTTTATTAARPGAIASLTTAAKNAFQSINVSKFNVSKALGWGSSASSAPSAPSASFWSSSAPSAPSASFWSSAPSTSSFFSSNATATSTSIGKMVAYVCSIAVVVLLILLFVHYILKVPIFQMKPGDSGYFSMPFQDDGKLYWDKGTASEILDRDMPIQNRFQDYSLQVDVMIQNPIPFSNQPRILFTRGATKNPTPGSTGALTEVFTSYNLAVALDANTTDLIVSVMNHHNGMETVILSNIPVQVPFRLGVVVLEKTLEVYVNGRLMKTRTYSTALKDVKGPIQPGQQADAAVAKLRNLKVWGRSLKSQELAATSPKKSTVEEMGATPIPSVA